MSSNIYPRDFFERRVKIDPKLCFIISPFKEEYDFIRKAVESIVQQSGFTAVHAEDIQQALAYAAWRVEKQEMELAYA